MLTIKQLRALKPKQWKSDGNNRGRGSLTFRGVEGGAHHIYFRAKVNGESPVVKIGNYSETGAPGSLTLQEARAKAIELGGIYAHEDADVAGYLARQKQAAQRARVAEEKAESDAAADAKRGVLAQLIEEYIGSLQRGGKQSARDVRSLLTLHVIKAAPDLVNRKASALAVDDFVSVIGALVEAGKGRTADKVRSYLRAAYALAIKSKTSASVPLALRAFGIAVNPIAAIPAMSEYNKARERVLSAPELGAYLRRVDLLKPGAVRDVLQLLLLLGGQRPVQFLRVTQTDVDLDANLITLRDAKGKRKQPRVHTLPMVKHAAAILARRMEEAGDGPLWSLDKRTHMRHETVSVAVSEISKAMVETKESREPFQLRDLRRTVETMLAALGVSSDVRAQLQSHGLGGVQQRHYNKHDYQLEKRAALEQWVRHLDSLKAGTKAAVLKFAKRSHAAE